MSEISGIQNKLVVESLASGFGIRVRMTENACAAARKAKGCKVGASESLVEPPYYRRSIAASIGWPVPNAPSLPRATI